MPKKGYIPTAEHRRRLSEACKGEKHPFYGKHHTAEARKKISNYRRRNDPMLGKEDGVKVDEVEDYVVEEDCISQAKREHKEKSKIEGDKLEVLFNNRLKRLGREVVKNE